MPDIKDIPLPTKRRLVVILQILNRYEGLRITSLKLSELTGWKDTLIRHDLWLIGIKKGVSNGYDIEELKASISQTLDSGKKNICIAGLGRLGAALLDKTIFDENQFCIKAGFDSNVNRVEILRSTFPLYPANEMNFIIRKENIEYAILAVQDKDAQAMTERLVKNGIKGIVNMTSVILKIPDGVKVENLSISNALKLVI